MPELPEVETVRRGLEPHLVGHQLRRVELLDPRLVRPLPPAFVRSQLEGRTVVELARRGKHLAWHLDDGAVAMVHLRMTGSFSVPAVPAEEPAHVRARFHTDVATIAYNDPRRFGTLLVLPDAATAAAWLDERLGPEPLGTAFTPAGLHASLHGRSTPVKAALLDQRVVAGLGNIYVDEALHRAGIAPLTSASRVSRPAAERLHRAIVDVLATAIVAGGSTLRDYRNVEGGDGTMQEHFRVYGRSGEPCETCGRTLHRGTIGGRTTVWCATCQPRR